MKHCFRTDGFYWFTLKTHSKLGISRRLVTKHGNHTKSRVYLYNAGWIRK